MAPNSNIIAIDCSAAKLQLAEKLGADHTLNSKESQDIKSEIFKITEEKGVTAVIDCVGAEETIRDSVRILSKSGVLVVVGLFGNQIRFPLVSSVFDEIQVQCSFWGNYNELCEVIELAKQGKIKHTLRSFSLNAINEAISLLRSGKVDGRAIIIPK